MNESTGDVQNLLQVGTAQTVNVSMPSAPVSALRGTRSSTPSFTGREAELGELGAAEFVVVSGMAGVGKTELALRFAEGFAGDRLFCDFHGYDSRSRTAGEALEKLLVDLGVREVPADEGNREALFRTCLADRDPVLVVLDNVSSAAQVRPLLVPGHRIVVTSRHRLTGLDGAHHLTLPVLPAEEAAELVGSEELASLCGNLPLALQIMAALRRSDPDNDWTADLRDTQLGTLDHDGETVRAAFDLSCRALPAAHRKAFPYLVVLPDEARTAEVVSALLDRSPAETRKLLRDLRTAHLLESGNAIHDLVRCYAQELLAEEPEARVDAAFDRALRHFATRSGTDADAYTASFSDLVDAIEGGGETRLEARALALRLAAAGALLDQQDAASITIEVGGDQSPRVVIEEALAAVAEAEESDVRAHDAIIRAEELMNLGRAGEAVPLLVEEIDRAEQRGHRPIVLSLTVCLGVALVDDERFGEAIACLTRVVDESEDAADVHYNLGKAHFHTDALPDSAHHFARAAALMRAGNRLDGEAVSLALLGNTLHLLGRFDERDHAWRDGLTAAEACGLDDLVVILRENLDDL
ncbi:hypothetical protein [Lentzea sp. NPDC003310]|uniref:hypothetical protein n=1 Tax=Lentzea sp. NPDC003310 TaxID=3154447 RepID=UPI0033B9879A